MKCDVIDHRCQPIPEPRLRSQAPYLDQAEELVLRLFRYRFLRARLFDKAMAELARREAS